MKNKDEKHQMIFQTLVKLLQFQKKVVTSTYYIDHLTPSNQIKLQFYCQECIFQMMHNKCPKRYFWELEYFTQCDASIFKQMKQNTNTTLYLYKQNHPSIIVRMLFLTQKIQGWAFRELQVLQKLNDNPKISHWKTITIPFKGQLILSELQSINKIICQQIDQVIPRKTKQLQSWMRTQIDDVFAMTTRSKEVFGSEHAFFQLKTIYRTRYVNYFQMRKWNSDAWQGLLEIARRQKIQKTCSFGDLLQEVNSFINSFQVIRDEKYTNMFDLHQNRKTSKRIPPQDQFEKKKQKKILQKYRLYEYIQA